MTEQIEITCPGCADSFITEIETQPEADDRLKARIVNLEREVEWLRGAQSAMDERLRLAAERAGLVFTGCDTPETLLDETLGLRARVVELEERLATAMLSLTELRATAKRQRELLKPAPYETNSEAIERLVAERAEANARAEAAEAAAAEGQRKAVRAVRGKLLKEFGAVLKKIQDAMQIPGTIHPDMLVIKARELATIRAQAETMTSLMPPTWYADRDPAWRLERLVEQWHKLHEVNKRLEAQIDRDAAVVEAATGMLILGSIILQLDSLWMKPNQHPDFEALDIINECMDALYKAGGAAVRARREAGNQ